MTHTRRLTLQAIADMPGCSVAGLPDIVCPRPRIGGAQLYWSAQGAARMGGKLVAKLENAGLVRVDRHVSAGVADAWLTAAGVKALAEASSQPCL